ncbi:hypothetical protein [Anaeromicropila herbilytica]|uniref:Uncharacterized protein n=1 Tax=Anaeromicropila herbilytica TaxID=2785025 RepID=A0A7R7EJL3_9FIRM|nr:hypothetical protein [Anaeromicropila herbilytica]BCN29968.1 hypothetical protein bsdtb5_12630 [Anaeromicropila herbilytica]
MEINYEVYSLSYRELAILLVSKGIDKIYGFPLEQITIDSDEKLIQTLHHMVKRKILTSDGEAFQINEPYETIINVLKEAKDIVVITPKTEELPMRCCYLGKKILVSEISIIQKDTMKLCFIERDKFIDFLEEGYLPEQLDKENEWVDPKEGVIFDLNIGELMKDETNHLLKREDIKLVIDKICTNSGKRTSRILIMERPLNYQIVNWDSYSNKEDVTNIIYTFSNMKERLNMLLREEEA